MTTLHVFGLGFLSGLAVPYIGFGSVYLVFAFLTLLVRGAVLFLIRLGPIRLGMFGAYVYTGTTVLAPATNIPLPASLGTIVGAVLSMSLLFVIRRRWNRGEPLFRGTPASAAVQSTSTHFRPGDVMLIVDSAHAQGLWMHQIFTDGRWYQVFGRLVGPNTLEMDAAGMRWRMARIA